MLEYLLLSRLNTNNIILDSLIIIFLIPLISYINSNAKEILNKIINSYNDKKSNQIKFIGWDNLSNGFYNFDYPYPMLALCHYINKKNLSNNIRQFNQERNRIFDHYDLSQTEINKDDSDINYIIDEEKNILIHEDIYIDFSISKMDIDNNKKEKNSISWKVTLIVKSNILKIEEIKKFIQKIIKDYNEYQITKNENKIYHFIYQGKNEKEKLSFSQSILKEFKNEKFNEDFDYIFSEHKDYLINTIKRLKDDDYHKKTGSKRKAGFLFYGPPGCGKTCHVNAIANSDKRHIIEIPMSRIQTNKELENIINLSQINNINFKKNEIILFFDEIDQAGNIISKKENDEDLNKNDEMKDLMILSLINKNNNKVTNNEDNLNLGCILSRLDGIGNYDGLIIIATTNHKENLTPSLYRNGRLTPMFFDYCRKIDIINMIQYNYDVKLSEEEINKLPDRKDMISPATLRQFIDEESDYLNLINLLHKKIK